MKLEVDEGKTYAYDDNNYSIQIYDKWKLMEQQVSPDDYANNNYDVKGILIIYNDVYEVYPILVSSTQGVENLTIDDDINAPAYNIAGQRVGNNYKGVVIKNGKKTIRK